MKTPRLLLSIVFLALPMSQIGRAQDPSTPEAASSPEPAYPRFLDKSGIRILSATYGSGTNFADVTDETTKLLNQQTKFYARPEWLRTDPTPGWNKELLIVFTYQNHRYLFPCGENGEVRVPLLVRIAVEKAATANL